MENIESYEVQKSPENKPAKALNTIDGIKSFVNLSGKPLFLKRLSHLSDEKAEELFTNELSYLIERLNANSYTASGFLEAAAKNPDSLKFAIANVAASGLTLRQNAKECNLIPRNGAILFEPEYRGLLKYIFSDSRVMKVVTELVYSSDKFTYSVQDGDDHYSHDFNPMLSLKDRGDLLGGYCAVVFSDGNIIIEIANVEKLLTIRKKASDKSQAWKDYEDDMYKKTLIKRWYSAKSKMLNIPENVRKNIEPHMEYIDITEQQQPAKNYAE